MTIEQVRPKVYGKVERLLHLMQMLSERPKRLRWLALELGLTDRSVRRYIELLRVNGIDVKEDEYGKYFICECPFCKKSL